VTYPHAVPIFGQDYKQEKQLYKQHFDLKKDIALINGLIKQGKVAVMGSFELALLQQSGRTPFLKYAPIIRSAPLDSNNVRGLRLKTKNQLLDLMNQLEQTPPAYIFMEKKLNNLPQDFYQGQTGLAILLSFVRNHYEQHEEGKYYLSFKRK
jgi:hypothetical protein